LVAAATCATAVIAPITYASAPTYLRVSGSSSSYVDVTLRAATALDYTRIDLRAKGSFAGVYIEPLTGSPEEGLGFVVPLKSAQPAWICTRCSSAGPKSTGPAS
jgi:hypothetical protein